MNNYGGGGYPQQPPGQQEQIRRWFQAVDADRSGQISATELQRALVNGNMSKFSEETCRMLISMFDNNHSGTIDVSLTQCTPYCKHDKFCPRRSTSSSVCSISSSSGRGCSKDSTETEAGPLRVQSSVRL